MVLGGMGNPFEQYEEPAGDEDNPYDAYEEEDYGSTEEVEEGGLKGEFVKAFDNFFGIVLLLLTIN